MKTHAALLLFAVLFGIAALAGAATDPAATPAFMVAPGPIMSQSAPDCAAKAANAANAATLPNLLPNRTYASTLCGACSQNPCKNAVINQACHVGTSTTIGRCLSPLGNDCAGTTAPACQCWSGIIP
jgi:hypothetical protein